MASVDGNASRNCASETPASLETSVGALRSKRSSANRARKAATIFSRSVVGGGGSAPVLAEAGRGGRLEALRAGLRAMTELLLDDTSATLAHHCLSNLRRRGRGSKVLRHYGPRACRAHATRRACASARWRRRRPALAGAAVPRRASAHRGRRPWCRPAR